MSLIGARQIAVGEAVHAVSRVYSVLTADMRPPLTYAWVADGSVSSPAEKTTNVTLRLPIKPAPEPGTIVPRHVTVHVSDADGLVQDATATVRLHVVSGDPDDDNHPPICKIKPWLPQCQN
jgi:hypothetical protein